jgi:hypothetical protein
MLGRCDVGPWLCVPTSPWVCYCRESVLYRFCRNHSSCRQCVQIRGYRLFLRTQLRGSICVPTVTIMHEMWAQFARPGLRPDDGAMPVPCVLYICTLVGMLSKCRFFRICKGRLVSCNAWRFACRRQRRTITLATFRGTSMTDDPIVAEIRKVRHEHAELPPSMPIIAGCQKKADANTSASHRGGSNRQRNRRPQMGTGTQRNVLADSRHSK